MSTFHHFGVPTDRKMEGMSLLEGGQVWVSDPEASPYRIEFLYFEPASPLPPALKSTPHAAFLVDDLDVALEGEQVVLEPFEATESLRVAFIQQDAALIELMEKRA